MATYFKNTELAARYNISEATVRNWVKSVKAGKFQLDLVEVGKRVYVAKSIRNITLIEQLVERNRKYRNTLTSKTIIPSKALFKVFSESQVYDIVRNLELHHEIPRQYGYFSSGAKEWDEYAHKQLAVNMPNTLRQTIDLLASNYGYLEKYFSKFKKVNVIDIGVGNATPVKGLLEHLIMQNKLARYVALDFSQDMLEIARHHLASWFGARLAFEGYQLDIAHERFANILAEDYLSSEDETINLVLFLGATPTNLRVPDDAFHTIAESLNAQDLFIYTTKLEAPKDQPEWFEYEIGKGKPEVTKQHRLVFDLLNIKDSYYNVEIGYDKQLHLRYARTKFKVALRLDFGFESGKRAVAFEKGDSIVLWRCWLETPERLVNTLERSGFYVLHSSQSEDRRYILTISEVQRD